MYIKETNVTREPAIASEWLQDRKWENKELESR
jgi:hypothetical protein